MTFQLYLHRVAAMRHAVHRVTAVRHAGTLMITLSAAALTHAGTLVMPFPLDQLLPQAAAGPVVE